MHTQEIPLDFAQYIANKCGLQNAKRKSYSRCMYHLSKTPSTELQMVIDSSDHTYPAYKIHVLSALDQYLNNKFNRDSIPTIAHLYNTLQHLEITESMLLTAWYAGSKHTSINLNDIIRVGPITYIVKDIECKYYIFDYSDRLGKVYTDIAYRSTCTYTLAWKRYIKNIPGSKLDPGPNEFIRSIALADDIFTHTALNLRRINEMARYTRQVDEIDNEKECRICYSSVNTLLMTCGHYMHTRCIVGAKAQGHCTSDLCIYCAIR